ncbi:MAG: hypothetical protein IOD12_09520 [Silvanigrellales bacterium]|nr:hypothetical protein [Silvanigrellales bacterium]
MKKVFILASVLSLLAAAVATTMVWRIAKQPATVTAVVTRTPFPALAPSPSLSPPPSPLQVMQKFDGRHRVELADGVLSALCQDEPKRNQAGEWECEVANACDGFGTSKASVVGAYAGRFSAPQREELVLDLDLDCAAHVEQWGGQAFLRRSAEGAWTVVTLGAGNRPGRCVPMDADSPSRRTLLVCESGYTSNGYSEDILSSLVYADNGSPRFVVLFRTTDDEGVSDCHAIADTMTWSVAGDSLSIDATLSRAVEDATGLRECATPLPRVDTVRKYVFTRQGDELVIEPAQRDLYLSQKKSWDNE